VSRRNPDGRAEALVIGAGLAGLAVARGLARRGARVTILEAAAVPGEGSACFASEGFVQACTPEPYQRMLAAIGVERAQGILGLSRRNAAMVEALCAAHPGAAAASGGLAVTTDPIELAELEAGAGALGWEILADASAVTSCSGAVGFIGGAMRREDLTVDPERLLAALELEAVQAGAEVRRGARVEAIDVSGERVTLRVRAGSDVQGEVAVLCSGAASPALHAALAPWIVAVPGQGLTMRGAARASGRRFSLSANFGHVRLAWTPGKPSEAEELRAWTIPWSLRRLEDLDHPCAIDAGAQQKLEGYARAHLPGMEEMQVVARRAARLAYTQDNLPLVGPLPGQPRIVCCTGFSGHDWSMALQAAEMLAAALSGSPRDPLLEILSPRRLMVA